MAFNVVGSGPASSAITVLTGTAPAGLAAPTTDYDSGLMSTVVQWVPATDDGGLPPLIYEVEILSSSLEWAQVDMALDCNAIQPDPNSIAALQKASPTLWCWLDDSVLTDPIGAYQLTSGSLVMARVTASNDLGAVVSTPGGSAYLP